MLNNLTKIKSKYHAHKANTRKRFDKNGNQIEFRLTFEEWYDIWIKSGHWDNRGRKQGQYVMSRKNDIGNYEIGNVFIQPVFNNHSETYHPPKAGAKAMLGKKGKDHPKSIRIQTPLGIFESIAQAAAAHNMHTQSMQGKLRKFPKEYKRLL
jgi:hypothetical protein